MTNPVPGPTGPLPRGWHRLRWVEDKRERWVVSQKIGDLVCLYATLTVVMQHHFLDSITEVHALESWMPGDTP
jgi:hypothetical protein